MRLFRKRQKHKHNSDLYAFINGNTLYVHKEISIGTGV